MKPFTYRVLVEVEAMSEEEATQRLHNALVRNFGPIVKYKVINVYYEPIDRVQD